MPYSDMLPNEFRPVIDQIGQLVSDSRHILVAAHVRPDGDAIGSVSGLVKSLISVGKKVEVALVDGVFDKFAFVFPDVPVLKQSKITGNYDLIFVLDSGDLERTGIEFDYSAENCKLVNIDHHASNTLFGDINYVDTSASSTCEMITAMLDYAQLPLDSNVAMGLMLGLVTDSRFFQNEGLRHTAHLAAAKLLQTGLDTSPILNALNSGRSETDLRVQGFGLSNFKLECDGKLATLLITHKDLTRLGAATGNIFASGIFNILLSIKQTMASVVAFEREDGWAFCEFRSRGGVNVKEVAVSLGGGGHIPASGCSRNVPVEELAQEAFEKMIKQVNTFFNSEV